MQYITRSTVLLSAVTKSCLTLHQEHLCHKLILKYLPDTMKSLNNL